MSGPSGIAGDQLRALVQRIEHIEDEIKGGEGVALLEIGVGMHPA